MEKFSIKEVFKKAWQIWKGNKKILTLLTLFVAFLNILPSSKDGDIVNAIFELVLLVITTFVGMVYLKSLLFVERGEKVEFKEIFRHAKYFWRYLFATILYGLLVGVGFILLIVPGIYFGLKYLFVPILILDKDMKIGEAFTQSALLTQDVKWKLLGFVLAAVGVFLLGALALGVGILVAWPLNALALIGVYKKLSIVPANPSPEAVVVEAK